MQKWIAGIVFLVLVLVSGCATTSFGSQQAGNFGSTNNPQSATAAETPVIPGTSAALAPTIPMAYAPQSQDASVAVTPEVLMTNTTTTIAPAARQVAGNAAETLAIKTTPTTPPTTTATKAAVKQVVTVAETFAIKTTPTTTQTTTVTKTAVKQVVTATNTLAIETASVKTCTPVTNANVVVYTVSSTGVPTQLTTTTTDTGGKFTFTQSTSSTKKSAATVTFGFDAALPSGYSGYIFEDGLSTSDTHTAQTSAGPTYRYTLCLGPKNPTSPVTFGSKTGTNPL